MKVPCYLVCQTRYNKEERVPLLLQCGHGFCRECLSRMFSASPDTTLACLRCRHMSIVGNSVQALHRVETSVSAKRGGGGLVWNLDRGDWWWWKWSMPTSSGGEESYDSG